MEELGIELLTLRLEGPIYLLSHCCTKGSIQTFIAHYLLVETFKLSQIVRRVGALHIRFQVLKDSLQNIFIEYL